MNKSIITPLLITIAIFAIATALSLVIHLNVKFIPSSFITHISMFILSAIVIYLMRNKLNFNISVPKFSTIFKPIGIALLATIIINILMVFLTKLAGVPLEGHKLLQSMTPLQVFLFVFILASIAEELLFRGFLQNSLAGLKDIKVNLLLIKVSLPVLISAITFGLAHLILISTGANYMFIIRIVLFTFVLGLIAGFYQEKYDNFSYAVIVHMSGNLFGLIVAIVMSLK